MSDFKSEAGSATPTKPVPKTRLAVVTVVKSGVLLLVVFWIVSAWLYGTL